MSDVRDTELCDQGLTETPMEKLSRVRYRQVVKTPVNEKNRIRLMKLFFATQREIE